VVKSSKETERLTFGHFSTFALLQFLSESTAELGCPV